MTERQTGSALERALARFQDRWGRPDLVVRAPGRVNLIGEHTDYNDGFALPMALPFDTVIVLASIGDPERGPVEIDSEGFGSVTIDPSTEPGRGPAWSRHLEGVVSLLGAEEVPAGGWRAVIATDIPTGASLSSSAALEVAAITGLTARHHLRWSPIEVARLGQRVENEVVGLPSGIMDQFISAGAVEGHAGLMDCRALTLTPAPLPDGVVVAVLDTGTRRVLAEAAYAERRRSCEQAAAELDVAALRDAGPDDVARLADPVVRRRARHVVDENQRTLDAARAMADGDLTGLGRLMSASHRSLRDDYEVSGPGLDAIVEVASTAPGCLGARMTGGGFAGCAVALVEHHAVAAFTDDVVARYDHDGLTARVWPARPAGGASLVEVISR